MKGIILAGGNGTRLHPVTLSTCKQLLPVYDKPMIYYPLSTLISADIKDILIIATPHDVPRFTNIFGNGSELGLNITYHIQSEPRGIADALILGKSFIDNDPVCLILGDNIFFGANFETMLFQASTKATMSVCSIFGYYVDNPCRYGVLEFDSALNKVIAIAEKPEYPKSNYVVTGLYFFPEGVSEIAEQVTPSKRGELEITDVLNWYLNNGTLSTTLNVQLLGRGFAWLDTGTHESLLDAGNFISTIEKRQGLKIGCIEEAAYKSGFIDHTQLLRIALRLKNTNYGSYLLRIANEF